MSENISSQPESGQLEPTWPAASSNPGQVMRAGVPAPTAASAVSTSGNAVAALVLSIASWVFCPVVFAIIALVFAHLGKKEIEASGGYRHGMELVTAARIVAWINIGLWAALLVIGLIIGFVVLVAGGLSSVTPGSLGIGSAGVN
ncbi:MAG: DUF4190 domain-containing protein [Candidatus Nanopelagicales bacterium]|nr:DUF4190 domain-containing protein [Candidatus Nanopelagicales bacterium]